MNNTHVEVKALCAHIGNDSLLVQGSGGNASWKDANTLWVKASGTSLSDAMRTEIFIPVDLADLKHEIARKNFHSTPSVIGDSNLRPSIETMLHALMPQKIVLHLHAVEILAHLVRDNPVSVFKKKIGKSLLWSYVPYFKPGADLAAAVAEQVSENPSIEVVFLQNHGVVIGANTIDRVNDVLEKLITLLQNPTIQTSTVDEVESINIKLLEAYKPCSDSKLNELATNKYLSSRIENEWVLYPDHAVFLGCKAKILTKKINFDELNNIYSDNPPFIFDLGVGVYESRNVTAAEIAQLRCYYDVLIRQAVSEELVTLSEDAVIDLLNWDAEKYRKKFNYLKLKSC